MRSVACAIKIPTRNLSRQVLGSTGNIDARDACLNMNHFVCVRFEFQHAPQGLSLRFTCPAGKKPSLGVNLNALERLRKLHCKINLATLSPDIGTSAANDRVVANDL